MLKKSFLYFLLLTAFYIGKAQKVSKISSQTHRELIQVDEPFTAIVIKTDSFLGMQVSVTLNAEEVIIPFDPDAPDFSYFISLPDPVAQATIKVHSEAQYQLFLINTGAAPALEGSSRYHQDECSFPFQAVRQSEWRSGLNAPDYTRSFTNVQHVVVHHSAGSNTSTNYTQVVRDIYTFHTEINGWSDIGYNYLVAQDGTIYAGRDPGSDGEQDNVLGAHFCGSNSTTMGICLLGNFQTAKPTHYAWNALQHITAFKLKKENLDPLEVYGHSLGDLGTIIGHRDGCSTYCPGDNLYAQMDDLRLTVGEMLDSCKEEVHFLDFSLSNSTPEPGEEVLVTNKSEGYENFKWIFEGGIPDTAFWVGAGSVKYLLPGNFDVQLIGFKKNHSDTLIFKDVISVKAAPVIHPNPANSTGIIHISSNEDPAEVTLYGLSGISHKLPQTDAHSFLIPDLKGGLYLIEFKVSGERYYEKILIND